MPVSLLVGTLRAPVPSLMTVEARVSAAAVATASSSTAASSPAASRPSESGASATRCGCTASSVGGVATATTTGGRRGRCTAPTAGERWAARSVVAEIVASVALDGRQITSADIRSRVGIVAPGRMAVAAARAAVPVGCCSCCRSAEGGCHREGWNRPSAFDARARLLLLPIG